MIPGAPSGSRSPSRPRRSVWNFATFLLVGALFFAGCGTFKVGGTPDWGHFSSDYHRPDKPIGGSVGFDFEDKKGRPHKVRFFGAVTSPELNPEGALQFRQNTVFYFGFWWTFDF